MIPILDKEVPKDLLEARTRRALAKGREVMDKGDPLRGRSRLFLEQLRTQVNHRFSLARHRRRHGCASSGNAACEVSGMRHVHAMAGH